MDKELSSQKSADEVDGEIIISASSLQQLKSCSSYESQQDDTKEEEDKEDAPAPAKERSIENTNKRRTTDNEQQSSTHAEKKRIKRTPAPSTILTRSRLSDLSDARISSVLPTLQEAFATVKETYETSHKESDHEVARALSRAQEQVTVEMIKALERERDSIKSMHEQSVAHNTVLLEENAQLKTHCTKIEMDLQDKEQQLRTLQTQSTTIKSETIRTIPLQLRVSGAGIDAVNGLYKKDSFSGKGYRYVMEGHWLGQQHRFVIFKFRDSGNRKYWSLSFIPPGKRPGTKADVDFYRVGVCVDQVNVPPADGWVSNSHGLDPVPLIEYLYE